MLAVTNIRQEVAHSSTKTTQKVWRKGERCLFTASLPKTGTRCRRLRSTSEGGDDVLDPRPGVGARDPHQGLQVVGAEGHRDGRQQGDEREHHPVHHPGVGAPVPVEQRLPVVAERDGDDGEVGADGEDGEEAQEVPQRRHVQHLAAVGEAERVHVPQEAAVETEDGGEGQQAVETQDEGVVRQHQPAHAPLVGDGRDERGQGVLAHEGVHAHPEQVGDPREAGRRGVAFPFALADADQGQDDHHAERWKREGWGLEGG